MKRRNLLIIMADQLRKDFLAVSSAIAMDYLIM